MDGAWASDDEQTVSVPTVQDIADRVPGLHNQASCTFGQRKFGFDCPRGYQGGHLSEMGIFDSLRHVVFQRESRRIAGLSV